MSTPKKAIVQRVVPFDGPDGRHSVLVDLEMEQPLGFRGGQYVIIDSGRQLADGRAAKRAYSLLSSDRDQRRFTLAARRIGDGPASCYLMGLEAEDIVTFSGPWGRMLTDLGDGTAAHRRASVVASGTGITAALGLVNSLALAEAFASVSLVWLDFADAPFLSPACVLESMTPAANIQLWYKHLSVDSKALDDAQLLAQVTSSAGMRPLGEAAAKSPLAAPPVTAVEDRMVFLTGDGHWIDRLRLEYGKQGLTESQIRSEYFFHRPVRAATGA